MRKTDINKYNDEASAPVQPSAKTIAKDAGSFLLKTLLTLLFVGIFTGIVILVSVIFYIAGIASEPLNINLNSMKLNQTSHVCVLKEDGEWDTNYLQLYSTENRVWVNLKQIGKKMVNTQIAIEDKRFYEHNGVDWYRTGGAVYSLATGKSNFGGSTITQQLIKNITDDNEVSITRKLREIFRALKLEEEYSKDDIIEAYLNLVNYGSGCRGVQSAAKLYFNKDIGDCSYAECAAIAGITQNPYAFDPLIFPERNKERRELVIEELYDQEIISKEEYDQAMKESENMKFIGYDKPGEEDDEDLSDWNWYDDKLFRQVTKDLSRELNISTDAAEDLIYGGGLTIYSAMDVKAQEAAERLVLEWKTPDDPKLDVGFIMMDYNDGRVLATVGGRYKKDGRLLWDNASQASLQPGSTIKPLTSFALALEDKNIHFSKLVDDTPVEKWSYTAEGPQVGPKNWYDSYYGPITVTKALNISSNAATVSVLKMVGLDRSYRFLTDKLHFKHLDEEMDHNNLAGLSIGGFYGGTTVEEVTSAYSIFCNGGFCYEPYTYYYVTDSEGNVLLDNRDRERPANAISPETSTIMNRLLYNVVNSGEEGLGYRAAIEGWDIIGKTGTTDASYDNWFVGASPYAVAGIWTGHSTPAAIAETEQSAVHNLWHDIMAEYLKGKPKKSFDLSGNVEQHKYLVDTGLLVSYDAGKKMAVGYYTHDNLPDYYKVETSKPESSSEGSGENTEPENTEPENTEPENTEPENTEPENTEPENTEPENTEPENTEPENTEPENTEPEPEPEPVIIQPDDDDGGGG